MSVLTEKTLMLELPSTEHKSNYFNYAPRGKGRPIWSEGRDRYQQQIDTNYKKEPSGNFGPEWYNIIKKKKSPGGISNRTEMTEQSLNQKIDQQKI